MKSKMFVVFDCKAGERGLYLQPFFMKGRGDAIRGWITAVNDPQTNFCQFPADYTLFEIGEYDEEKGSVTMYESKVSLGNAVEFKKQPEEAAPLLRAIEEKKGN